MLNDLSAYSTLTSTATKHRGYAFITFANPADAQEAIDNYDLNELPAYRGQGKFLKCSIAAPNKYGTTGEKAGEWSHQAYDVIPLLMISVGVGAVAAGAWSREGHADGRERRRPGRGIDTSSTCILGWFRRHW